MGNTHGVPREHLRIYENLLKIQSSQTRVTMINTLLQSPEHIQSAKITGIYSYLLLYIESIRSGKQSLLPGEQKLIQAPSESNIKSQNTQTQVQLFQKQATSIKASQKSNQKAMDYFSACLRILELEEEVALTDDLLKTAYKKAVIKAHPDKGGSEKEFEAVTKAYAYLGEIIMRIKGGRKVDSIVENTPILVNKREQEADKWKNVEPTVINPKKMDMNLFNKLFDEYKMPDPENSGYGDWLKGSNSGPREKEIDIGPSKFSGKFNREVFENAFRDEMRGKQSIERTNALMVKEMPLVSRYATEIGRGEVDDYTAANDDNKFGYTDLKKAYTEYNTFSQNVSNVNYDSKSFDQAVSERKSAPQVLRDEELEGIQMAERRYAQEEEERRLRLAKRAMDEQSTFERMQKLLITRQ